MSPAPLEVSAAAVRRLAVEKQHLADPLPGRVTSADILRVVRELGCLQLDPISVVAPSPLLVLWSRLGGFPRAEFDRLLWEEHRLFEYWAHSASIVLTEDYPLYRAMMRGDRESIPSWMQKSWRRWMVAWVRRHGALREHVLGELRRRGPLLLREFDHPRWSKRRGVGWDSGSDIAEMLQMLYFRGEVMVAGRVGIQRKWDLAERCLPADVPRTELTAGEVEHIGVQRGLRALGVASPREIHSHFLRRRYPRLQSTLARLEAEEAIVPVRVRGWPSIPRYVHADDLERLTRAESARRRPRTTLLAPFDNLICDRARTEQLFGVRLRFEGYVPKGKRQFGPYALWILHGDRLVGRVDPLLDRAAGVLRIRGVHAEPGAASEAGAVRGLRRAVDDLAGFLGASEVVVSGPVPSAWRGELP
ncbi:MAG: winged helix-turn-helix domain-containing protein [Thermoplasmata archaeon]